MSCAILKETVNGLSIRRMQICIKHLSVQDGCSRVSMNGCMIKRILYSDEPRVAIIVEGETDYKC